MKLTSANVESVLKDCLFNKGEDQTGATEASCITAKFFFHPGRLETHKAEIKELLDQLPVEFQTNSGGGWSFLNACVTRDGEQWGDHAYMEALLALGIATKQAKILLPRPLWSALPGGMPYFAVTS